MEGEEGNERRAEEAVHPQKFAKVRLWRQELRIHKPLKKHTVYMHAYMRMSIGVLRTS